MIFAEANVHPAVSDERYNRFLRYPARRKLEGPLEENAAWARDWYAQHGRPWLCALPVSLDVRPGDGLRINDTDVGAATLATRFAAAGGGWVVAVSAGPEAEDEAAERWAAGEPDRYFFLESYAAAVVDALLAEASRRLQAHVPPAAPLGFYCPGYVGWPATDTQLLLDLLQTSAPLPGALSVLPSGMLRPKKSQLALFGVSAGKALPR